MLNLVRYTNESKNNSKCLLRTHRKCLHVTKYELECQFVVSSLISYSQFHFRPFIWGGEGVRRWKLHFDNTSKLVHFDEWLRKLCSLHFAFAFLISLLSMLRPSFFRLHQRYESFSGTTGNHLNIHYKQMTWTNKVFIAKCMHRFQTLATC